LSFGVKKTEIGKILWKIALIQWGVEAVVILAGMVLLNGQLFTFSDAMVAPIICVLITSPLITYFVIRPYLLSRNAYEKEMQRAKDAVILAQKKNEEFLKRQRNRLASQVKRATKELSISQERYALAADGANDGLWDWDLKSGSIYFSKRWKQLLGYSEQEFKDDIDFWFCNIHPDDLLALKHAIDESKYDYHTKHYECECRMRTKKNSYIWGLIRWSTIFNNKREPIRMVGSLSNVSRRKNMENQIVHDAMHDRLTGLPNRRLLLDRLEQALLRYRRHDSERFSFLLLEIQNFNRINDTLGHKVGDQLLHEFSMRLEEILRESDTLARVGGDEFAFILHGMNTEEDVRHFIDRIKLAVTIPFKLSSTQINLSISMGIVIVDTFHRKETGQVIMVDADLALYQSRKNCVDNIAIFDPSMRKDITKQFEISNLLTGAIKRKEIQLFYQPIVDIHTNKVAGFEALMRWHHPHHGWISPALFIPIAEESEVIHELGSFALQQACSDFSRWKKFFPKNSWFMSINVSGRQFEKTTTFSDFSKNLELYDINPENIKLEITETVLADYNHKAVEELDKLKEMGVKLALDDFGVGYSSLSSLYKSIGKTTGLAPWM